MPIPVDPKQAQQIVQELNGMPCMRFMMPMGAGTDGSGATDSSLNCGESFVMNIYTFMRLASE